MATRSDIQTWNAIDWTAVMLVVVGALNWLLVGALAFDLVAALFGEMSAFSRIVYVLVGLAGLWVLFRALSGHLTGRLAAGHPTTVRT